MCDLTHTVPYRSSEKMDWMAAARSVCRLTINCIAHSTPQVPVLCHVRSTDRTCGRVLIFFLSPEGLLNVQNVDLN